MDYLPRIHLINVPKEAASPDEYVNDAVIAFIRAEVNINQRVIPRIERVSDTKYILHYQSAKR